MTSEFRNEPTMSTESSERSSAGRSADASGAEATDFDSAQGASAPVRTGSGAGSSAGSSADCSESGFPVSANSRVNFTMSSESGSDFPLTSYWEYNASTPNSDDEGPTASSRPDGVYVDPVDLLCSHPKKPSILKKWDQSSSSANTQCVSFEIDLVDEPLRRTKSSESNLSFDSETGYWSEISDHSAPGGILKHGLSSSSGGSLGSSRRSSEDFSKVESEGKSILRRSSLGSTTSSESGLQSILKRKLSDTTGAGTQFRFNRSSSSVSLPETKTILKSTESLSDVEPVQLKPILKKSSEEAHSTDYSRIRPILKKNSRNQRSSSTGSILKSAERRSTHGILKNSASRQYETSHCRLSLEDAMDRTDSEEELLLTLSVAERTSLFMQYEMEGSGLRRQSPSSSKCVKGRGRATTQPITTVEMLQALSIKAAEQRRNEDSLVQQPEPPSPSSPPDEVDRSGSGTGRRRRSPEPQETTPSDPEEQEEEARPTIVQRSESPQVKFSCPEVSENLFASCPLEPCTHTACSETDHSSYELKSSHNPTLDAFRRHSSVPLILNYFHGTSAEIRRIPPNDPESFVQFFSSPVPSSSAERVDEASFASLVRTSGRLLLGTRRSVRVTRKHRNTTNPLKSSQRISRQYYLQPSPN